MIYVMKNKKAFTLVELLVVIGIIAALTGVLLGTFGKANDAALSAVCMSNLKNLGTASSGVELFANSGEQQYTTTASRGSNFTYCYMEKRGWISWYSKGLYFEANPGDWRSYSPQSASCKRIGMFSKDPEEVQYAYSHGSLFGRLSGNTSCYVCPLHKKLFPSVNWSYFMPDPGWKTDEEIEPNPLKSGANNDRKLLFGEIPFVKGSPGDWFPSGEAVTKETDAALQVDGDNPENIGANHKVGKDWVAHVAFMDGHVEKIRIPKTMTGADLRALSKLLVAGKDITFTGSKYEEFR